jgi:hypothetical protein
MRHQHNVEVASQYAPGDPAWLAETLQRRYFAPYAVRSVSCRCP